MHTRKTLFTILCILLIWMANVHQSTVVLAADGDPIITVDKDNLVPPGTDITIALQNFPGDTWIQIDFGNPPPNNLTEVFTSAEGSGARPHTYDCGLTAQVRAWPLDAPDQITTGPTIVTQPCDAPPHPINSTISGPLTGTEGIAVNFSLTGTIGMTDTVRFGDGVDQFVIVTIDENGNASTSHTYARGTWTVSVDGGNSYDITINPPECQPAECPPPPPITVTISGPPSALEGEIVNFNLTGASHTEITVQFGNGITTTVLLDAGGNGSTWHQYTRGDYTVSVDGGNSITLIIHPAGGTIPPPETITGTLVAVPSAVAGEDFQVKVVRATSNITLTIVFGDNTQTDIRTNNNGRGSANHQFAEGEWLVRLLYGTTVLDQFLITVTAAVVPVDMPTINGPPIAEAGTKVSFSITGTPDSWVHVNFDDGSLILDVQLDADGHGSASHTFAVGTYHVGVTAGEAGGNSYRLEVVEKLTVPVYLPLVQS